MAKAIMLFSSSSHRALGLLAMAVLVIYLVISVVLHVCLEAVDTEEGDDWLKSNNKHINSGNRMEMITTAGKTGMRQQARGRRNKKRHPEERQRRPSSRLRSIFERKFPPNDMERVQSAVRALRVKQPDTQPNMPYDIYNCPDTPPVGYPMTWLLSKQILNDWNPKDTDIPERIYQGLCVFYWDRDQDKAAAYREAEVPFVVQNNPEILRASERWNHDGYLRELIGPQPEHNEYSKNAHLMYWKDQGENPRGWKPPTENIQITFDEWIEHAKEMENHKSDQAEREHFYFRLKGDLNREGDYLFDELPIFLPGDKPSFYLIDPSHSRGINCRLGMRGNIAETHYDGSRNWIVVMGGQRRYILAHPDQCMNMELYHFGHPSARHSSIDWTNPPPYNEPRPFSRALAQEVVLQPGDSLYLPDSYFHFIVSLNINYQCNARSGETVNHRELADQCELGVPKDVY